MATMAMNLYLHDRAFLSGFSTLTSTIPAANADLLLTVP